MSSDEGYTSFSSNTSFDSKFSSNLTSKQSEKLLRHFKNYLLLKMSLYKHCKFCVMLHVSYFNGKATVEDDLLFSISHVLTSSSSWCLFPRKFPHHRPEALRNLEKDMFLQFFLNFRNMHRLLLKYLFFRLRVSLSSNCRKYISARN